ncbi:BspA family leucine-rich repeat surface protein [Bifidobacterium sp. ESL0763]|uniref:BspA family leucine-rich repeat surface protein n=1 Tax=Bifidobacterium sp. ESL0763 TaxID=2983227 RepID=UPI0023F7D700|nr:BspA family leucine-rich repeat surface protein [Bifidobacterium sp. ESL0763]MDF7664478.1 BspA family leucine-rich repeat surface protein [Bifidobacterium sp. ESL0763]
MKKQMKALAGVLAAVAMLAVPAFAQADEIQRSHPEDTGQAQVQDPAQRADGQKDAVSQQSGPVQADSQGQKPVAPMAGDTSKPKGDVAKSAVPQPTAQDLHPSAQVAGQATVRIDSTGSAVIVNSPDAVDTLDKTAFRNVLNYSYRIKQVKFTGGTTQFPQDSSNLFSHLGLTNISGLDKVDTSNVTNMYAMFYNAQSLTGLDLSSFDTSNVTNMGYMFGSLPGLTSLDLSSFDTSNVTNMQYMIGADRNLTSLDLSNFDTSNVTDMSGMLYYDLGLASLDLSSFDTSNVTDMNSMFYYDLGLASLDLSSFDTSNVTDMSGMFWDCRSLTGLDLSNFDTSNVTDMRGILAGISSKLSQLKLGASTKLRSDVFEYTCYIGVSASTCSTSPSVVDGYTGKWTQMQVSADGTVVAKDNGYTVSELLARTQSTDPNRAGTYVWQQKRTLTLEASTVPMGLHARGDAQPKTSTVLGGVVALPSGASASSFRLLAPGSRFDLLDSDNNPASGYQFAGWSATGPAMPTATPGAGMVPMVVYHEGDTVNVTRDTTLYEMWMPKAAGDLGSVNLPLTNNSSPAPILPSQSGTGAAGAGARGNANTVPLAGSDHISGGRTVRPRVVKRHKDRCAMPTGYISGTTIPVASNCRDERSVATVQPNNVRQVPWWILLLLAIAAIAVMVGIRYRSDSPVAQHRSADVDE